MSQLFKQEKGLLAITGSELLHDSLIHYHQKKFSFFWFNNYGCLKEKKIISLLAIMIHGIHSPKKKHSKNTSITRL